MKALPGTVEAVCRVFLGEVDARLPGRLTGLLLHGSICWGEFFHGSDIDFVGIWDRLPTGTDLDDLAAAHEATRLAHPSPDFDGFHCTAADLASEPLAVATRPAMFQGKFEPAGTVDINPVTWHELAERPVVVRGPAPAVHTDLERLVAFTRHNLDTYWRGLLGRMEGSDVVAVGADDDAVAWLALGAPRLHHLLRRRELTSKSGAGRYVLNALDPRWARISREALRIRERPDEPGLYTSVRARGEDVLALLRWVVEDDTQAAG